MAELLIGAGNRHRSKKMIAEQGQEEWTDLTTLDISRACNPDVLWDLRDVPYPFTHDTFAEIHAYEVMEHVHQQGDYQKFFEIWSELYRIMEPDGLFYGTSPHYTSPWCWMDPGHTCAYGSEIFAFLDQKEYRNQVGHTPMTDYREIYTADWRRVHVEIKEGGTMIYVLKAIKPALDDTTG